jgi:hypothetical protein
MGPPLTGEHSCTDAACSSQTFSYGGTQRARFEHTGSASAARVDHGGERRLGVASMNVVKPQASSVVSLPPDGRALDGRYRLEVEIGSGGLGAVYRATHEKLDKPVAIKLLHAHCDGDAVARGRWISAWKATCPTS